MSSCGACGQGLNTATKAYAGGDPFSTSCRLASCGVSQCSQPHRSNFCRSSAPLLQCCLPNCPCPEPASVPLPCCPKVYCAPLNCPVRRSKKDRSPRVKLPPHCLCPAGCAPPPCCQKQCVVISRCSCPAKPALPDPCCAKVGGPMRLPYAAPPCTMPSSCAPQDPRPYCGLR